MKRILIVFAHPFFESSRVNRALLAAVSDMPNVVVHDLYETYPYQLIDVEAEQHLLMQCDVLILQHPLFWYSCPALMKNWLDSVLTLGWAYGPGGEALRDKVFAQAISSGGAEQVYQRDGHNKFTLAELLRPFEQTAGLCEMHYIQPFLTQGAGAIEDDAIADSCRRYRAWLEQLSLDERPPAVATHQTPATDFLPL